MIEVKIPGRSVYKFEYLVLDLNGTVSLDGEIMTGVPERIESLRNLINIVILTADTRGKAEELGKKLQVEIRKVHSGDEQVQKFNLVQELGSENTVAIGNGTNDVLMLKESALGICVLGLEGASSEAMNNSDLMIPDINSSLDLLLKPERLIATLRK